MDDVVALSTMLRARQHHATTTSATLDDIPHLTRSLPQVHADSTRLLSARVASTAAASPPETTSVHPAALRLFASVGFEVDRLRRAVSAVDTAASFVDIPARAHDPHRHPAWLAPRALDDARLSMNAALREAARDAVTADLVAANARLVSRLSAELDPAHRVESAVMPTSPHTLVAECTPRRARSDGLGAIAVATAVEERYVDAIRAIALHGDAPSAPFLLHEVAAGIPDAPHFVESLAVVASVARHADTKGPPSSDMAVWGARVVLEDQFAERIPGLPQKPRLAMPAAVVPAIADYVRELQRQGHLGGMRDRQAGLGGRGFGQDHTVLWAQVYYCMRVGHVGAALAVLQEANRVIYPEAERIVQFFQRFLQGRDHARNKFRSTRVRSEAANSGDVMEDDAALDEDTPTTPGYLIAESDYVSVETLYKEIAWTSNDPFMRACFVLLLRLELLSEFADVHRSYPPSNKRQKCAPALPDVDMSFLFGSVEDYMWFRLWLCRTPVESEAIASLSDFTFVCLEEIQDNIVSCGSAHFDPDGSQPLLYAFVLVCCGLYEDAVGFLTTQTDEHLVHCGAHLAIVAYQLHWITNEEAFHSVLLRYVALIASLFPTEAALYLMTIRDRKALHKLVCELVVRSGEYVTLLGSVRDGERHSGTLAKLLSSASVPLLSGFSLHDLEAVRLETALLGASDAASKGEYSTAAQLYTLAGRPSESAEMTMRNLADVVDKKSSSKRPLAVADARSVLRAAGPDARLSSSDVVINSLEVLLKMATVFEEYWKGRYGTAWDALRDVKVLPLASSDISSCRRDLASSGDKYSPYVQRCSGELLKAALHIAERALELGCVDKASLYSPGDNAGVPTAAGAEPRKPDSAEIKSLCIFAGLMRISQAEVNERLVRIELLSS